MISSVIKAGHSKVNSPNNQILNACEILCLLRLYALNNVIYGLFQQSRANSKVTGLIRPKFELVLDLMPGLVTCKFDKDPIKNERAGVETSFFPLYYDNFSSAQWRVTLKRIIQTGWNLN